MIREVKILDVWTAPNGKVKVITTAGQEKINCYDLALFQYVIPKAIIQADVVDAKKQDGTPIKKLINITVDGSPLKAEAPPSSPQPSSEGVKPSTYTDDRGKAIEQAVWWKELGCCIREKDIDTTKPLGKFLREFYYAEMFRVLNVQVDKVKELICKEN